MNMQLLWDYQKADLALSRFEDALKKSKTRSRLLTVRNDMVEQQNRAKKLDNNLRDTYPDCDRIGGEIKKINSQIASLKEEAENCQDQDLRQVRLVLRAMEECNKTLSAMYKQVEQIHAIAEGTTLPCATCAINW
jgi:DNA repair exonuclease SbcCD ATPase subunit